MAPERAPRLSVVMPAFDAAPVIEEAIGCVLGQTFRDLELIVVDDGSTDETASIVERIDDGRIRLVRSEHAGYVAATNQGLAVARGELVARADADDVYLPELFERQIAVLDAHPEVAAVGAWVRSFGGLQVAWPKPTEPRGIRSGLRIRTTLSQPVVIRMSAIRQVGPFRPVRWEDWDMWIRLASRWDLRIVPEYLILYRVRAGSAYHGSGRLERCRARLAGRLTAAREFGYDLRSVYYLGRNLVALTALRALGSLVPPLPDPRPAASTSSSVSVVVPSYGRPELLTRCLAAVEDQQPAPDEVVVAYRRDDPETDRVLRGWTEGDPDRHKAVAADGPGIVPALAAGTRAARSSVVAYLDDDAVPRPGWLAEIRRGFLDPTIGAVGGRFVDHVQGRAVTGRARSIGRLTWYGRVIGGHHLESHGYSDVEFLGGTNWALRRELAHHDPNLLHASTGLALANELDACLTVRRLGHRLLYTPWAVVDHFTTSFRDPVLGSRVAGSDVFTSAANYTYALLKYLPLTRRVVFRVYAFVVGTAMLPGPGRAAIELFRSPRRAAAMTRRIPTTWRGRLEGMRMFRRWRRTGATVPSPDGRILETDRAAEQPDTPVR